MVDVHEKHVNEPLMGNWDGALAITEDGLNIQPTLTSLGAATPRTVDVTYDDGMASGRLRATLLAARVGLSPDRKDVIRLIMPIEQGTFTLEAHTTVSMNLTGYALELYANVDYLMGIEPFVPSEHSHLTLYFIGPDDVVLGGEVPGLLVNFPDGLGAPGSDTARLVSDTMAGLVSEFVRLRLRQGINVMPMPPTLWAKGSPIVGRPDGHIITDWVLRFTVLTKREPGRSAIVILVSHAEGHGISPEKFIDYFVPDGAVAAWNSIRLEGPGGRRDRLSGYKLLPLDLREWTECLGLKDESWTPPGAPRIDPGFLAARPSDEPEDSAWRGAKEVRYAVSYFDDQSQSARGPWSAPYRIGYARPKLFHVGVDATGRARGRLVYRQFDTAAPELVMILNGNTATESPYDPRH